MRRTLLKFACAAVFLLAAWNTPVRADSWYSCDDLG